MNAAVYDVHACDTHDLKLNPDSHLIQWQFYEFRLLVEMAGTIVE